jgi:hypothetical protein
MVHRGTKRTNFGAYFTEVVDVFFKHHVPQIDPATSLANTVVELLREFRQEKGNQFSRVL